MSQVSLDAHAEPVLLDPARADLHTEAAALRDRGPAPAVQLPGGVRVRAVTDPVCRSGS